MVGLVYRADASGLVEVPLTKVFETKALSF